MAEELEQNSRGLTFGETLVGLNFNPANDDNVSKAKQLCAELVDLLRHAHIKKGEHTELQAQLYNHALGEILNAQMNVVKVITFNK